MAVPKKKTPIRVEFEVKRAIEDSTDRRMETIRVNSKLRKHLKFADADKTEVLELLEKRFRVSFTDDEEMEIETVKDVCNLMKIKLQHNE